MNKIVNGVANDYEFPMYYEPKISTNRQAGKTQQMFYELSIELSKKQQELNQCKNNWEELKKYVKETFKDTITVSNGIIYENKPIYEEISNKMKELEDGK